MTIENLREYTHFSKYGLFQKELGRKETRGEAFGRMFGMHRTRYLEGDYVPPNDDREGLSLTDRLLLTGHIDYAEQAALNNLIIGSQRALQYGGKASLDKHARIYNCTYSYADRPRFFQEAFWLLLCGCGTGFSVQGRHIKDLPAIAAPKGNGSTLTYVVPDTIEGWADAAGMLLSSYFIGDDIPFPEAQGRRVEFDFSGIRKEGAWLSSGAGKAPGPEPLRKALEAVRALLDRVTCLAREVFLRAVDVYDIIMHLSEAVLSGGVRRSASICLFDHDDEEMLNAKRSPTWFTDNPQRQNSNNSMMLLRGSIDERQFHKIKETTRLWGEPAYVWTDDLDLLVNPCVEIGGYAKIRADEVYTNLTGISALLSGWQFCNLSAINVAACRDRVAFLEACHNAAVVGTLQAGYTDFSYLGPVSEAITRKEALLGVSMTGMMDNPRIAFDYELQRQGAQVVLDTNAMIAKIIGINPAARATCVKPEGTSSCFLGTASGIHPWHSRRLFRNVVAKQIEAAGRHYRDQNPDAVQDSMRKPGEDHVLSFMIELPDYVITKDELGAVELLERVRQTRLNWVESGRRPERCVHPWITHNVSNTINVKDHEWDEVYSYIHKHREHFAGVACLSHYGDLDYAQAPFQSVETHEELLAVHPFHAIIEGRDLVDQGEKVFGNLWGACSKVLNSPVPQEDCKEQRFFSDLINFAHEWTGSNIKEATYLLKKIGLARRWEHLSKVMKKVDYTTMTEDDGIRMETIQACAGGSCDI